MRIYDVNKLLSSENKSKIISHFWTCTCHSHNINSLSKKLDITQSNLSKHIGVLLKFGVLSYKQMHKERFYFINKSFKNDWFDVIKPQIESRENIKYICDCAEGHHTH